MDSKTHMAERTERMNMTFTDVSNRALVRLSGPDALDLLHRMSTNNLLNLAVGETRGTILTTEKGRVLDILSVVRLGSENLLMVGHSEEGEGLRRWIEKFIIMEDVKTEDVQKEFSHLIVLGGDGKDVPGGDALSFVEQWKNVDLHHSLIPSGKEDECFRWLKEKGAVQISHADYDRFRIRMKIPAWPHEISSLYNPLECDLRHLVSWTKGCYIGQEVIARLDTYQKVRWTLVRVESEKKPVNRPATIRRGSADVGILTSVCAEAPFEGLAFLDREGLVSGTGLSLGGQEEECRISLKE